MAWINLEMQHVFEVRYVVSGKIFQSEEKDLHCE